MHLRLRGLSGPECEHQRSVESSRCVHSPFYRCVGAAELTHVTAITDDLGNFFVQCDNCHVWQHGGCLGLTDDSMLPDEYYCEKCRPEYHKIIKASHL